MIWPAPDPGYDPDLHRGEHPEHREESVVTTPDLREARFLLKRRALAPFERWEKARAAVEEAWRGGAQALSDRLARLEEERRSLARDPKIARTRRAREGLDRALDARRRECEAIRDSPQLRQHREARAAELAARTALAAAATYEWREYEARLARLKKDYPRQWDEYEAEERSAGREPVHHRDRKPLLPGNTNA